MPHFASEMQVPLAFSAKAPSNFPEINRNRKPETGNPKQETDMQEEGFEPSKARSPKPVPGYRFRVLLSQQISQIAIEKGKTNATKMTTKPQGFSRAFCPKKNRGQKAP
jgi:hypothetical protein